jgi:hypothetical protein
MPRLGRARPRVAVIARVAGPGAAPAPPVPNPILLPGNLLSVADSDFESSLTGDWTTTNCGIGQSSVQAFHGAYSLAITATSSGTASIASPLFPAAPLLGYVLSGYAYAVNTGRTVQAGANWYTSGSSYLSSSFPAATSLTDDAWTPVASAVGSPATAGKIQLVFQILNMNAGETAYLDLLYGAQSVWQILVAWGSSPLAATPAYADMTPWTRADKGISNTRGRSDEVTSVQPGTAAFTLDNSQPGWFAQGNPGSPYGAGITLGKIAQLNAVDETGTWHTRFTGFITDGPATWQGGPAIESTVTFALQDIMGWLGRSDTLRTMVEQEVLYDQPICFYTLADATGSVTAADTSGNAAPALVQHKYGTGTSSVTLGSQGNVIGPIAQVPWGITSSPLTSATFVGSGGSGNTQLEGPLPQTVSAASGFSADVWCSQSTADIADCVINIAHSKSGASLSVIVDAATLTARLFYLPSRGGTPVNSSTLTTVNVGATIYLFVTVSGTTATLYCYPAGVGSTVTLTVPAGFTANYLTVGGIFGGGRGGTDYNGSINCVAVYNSVLSLTRFNAHWSAGAYDNWGGQVAVLGTAPTVTQLILNTIRYAGIPSSFVATPPTGVSYPDAYDITGQTPLSMLQLYQQIDGGVLYVSAAGLLTWQDRAARYAAQITPALTLQAGQYESPLPFGPSTQFMVNSATYANNAIPGGVKVVNTTGVAANGTWISGDPASPVTGPWFSYTLSVSATPSGDVLGDATSWTTNIYGTPVPRSPSLTIDLGSAMTGSGTQVSRAACYATDVGSVIALEGLPSSGPGGTRANFLMAEGLTETFRRTADGTEWTLAFNTSPASQSAAWIAGDPNLGVLDSTAVVGRGTDGTSSLSGGNPVQSIGAPYTVPTFSSTMNRTGNVGANDMRGLASNIYQSVYPPVMLAQQVTTGQSIANATNSAVDWDTVIYDTSSGWAASGPNGGAPNSTVQTWVVTVGGVYLLMAVIEWAANSTGDRLAWFTGNGAQFGTQADMGNAGTAATGTFISVQATLPAGTTIQVLCYQTSGGSLGLSTANGGCTFSALWLGN